MHANENGDERVLIISSDCHAGTLPSQYNDYMPAKYHDAANAWWVQYTREMMSRVGTFFDQEAVEAYDAKAGDAGRYRRETLENPMLAASDKDLIAMLADPTNPFAPRRGEWDPIVRMKELDDDGTAGEVIFPQMAPFGAGLMQYRHAVTPELNLAGCRAYNRWLADLCKANPARMAGVALVNVDDIDTTVQEIRDAKAWGSGAACCSRPARASIPSTTIRATSRSGPSARSSTCRSRRIRAGRRTTATSSARRRCSSARSTCGPSDPSRR